MLKTAATSSPKAPAWYFEWRMKESRRIQSKLNAFLVDEGVKLVIYPAAGGDGGPCFRPAGATASSKTRCRRLRSR